MARFEVGRSPTAVSRVRDRVRLLPELTDLAHPDVDDLVLIVSELVSNAVAAASLGSTIGVDVVRDGDVVEIAVDNAGPPLRVDAPPRLPSSTAVCGRGLAIVSLLSESVTSHHRAGTTRVIARRRVAQLG